MTAEPIRALVTRPAEDARSLCAQLRALGVEPIVEPLMTIEPAAEVTIDLAGVQAVLLTSRNGARTFAVATVERDIAVLAVGNATADAARTAGFKNVLSAGGAGKDLETLVGTQLAPQAGRLVHAGGETVAGDLIGALTAKGFTVAREVLYKAVPATAFTASTSALISEKRLALALFLSPRTAAIFAGVVRDHLIDAACDAIRAVFISHAASRATDGLPWRGTWCATRPDMTALIDAVKLARQEFDETPDENT